MNFLSQPFTQLELDRQLRMVKENPPQDQINHIKRSTTNVSQETQGGGAHTVAEGETVAHTITKVIDLSIITHKPNNSKLTQNQGQVIGEINQETDKLTTEMELKIIPTKIKMPRINQKIVHQDPCNGDITN